MKTFCWINEGTSYAAHWLISIFTPPQPPDEWSASNICKNNGFHLQAIMQTLSITLYFSPQF